MPHTPHTCLILSSTLSSTIQAPTDLVQRTLLIPTTLSIIHHHTGLLPSTLKEKFMTYSSRSTFFKAKMCLFKLPTELILLIVEELVAEDVYALATTCRHLESICLPVYIRVTGMQVCKGVLSLERPDFGPPLGVLAKPIPANSSIKTLHITGPACVVEVLATQLHNVGGITSLSIRGRNESTFQLRDILLPNLTECSLEGLLIHGASLKAFLARHPRLRRLTIDIRSKELLSPMFPHHVYFCPEMATTDIELPILSALTYLVISVPSALLFLRQPHSLPNLSVLKISPATMDSTPQYFWDLFATEGVFPNLEKIIIESTSLAGWIFDCGVALGEHVSMFMAIPIQSVKFLAFEGSMIDRAGHSSLDPQCLGHLSKWLPRFFPNLQTLTMHNIFIFKDARDQEDSVSCLYSMVGISPIIEIYHDKYARIMDGTVSYE